MEVCFQDLKDDKLPFLSLAVACLQSSCGSSLWVKKRLSWDDNLGLSTYVDALLCLIDIIIAQLIVGSDHVALRILNSLETRLMQEYVKGISSTGMQSNHGFEGQINACWTHKMTKAELELIRTAGFLISVIHGRYVLRI